MTGLGASLYLGFFALAALWLFLTSDVPLTRRSKDQDQRAARSNSARASAWRPSLASRSPRAAGSQG